jgi:hypothetical protein
MTTARGDLATSCVRRESVPTLCALVENCLALISRSQLHGVVLQLWMLALGTILLYSSPDAFCLLLPLAFVNVRFDRMHQAS